MPSSSVVNTTHPVIAHPPMPIPPKTNSPELSRTNDIGDLALIALSVTLTSKWEAEKNLTQPLYT